MGAGASYSWNETLSKRTKASLCQYGLPFNSYDFREDDKNAHTKQEMLGSSELLGGVQCPEASREQNTVMVVREGR